jgi:cell wall assembly regulator SMI1
LTDQPTILRQQELTRSLAQWLMDTVNSQPGWDQLRLDLKPVGQRWFLRVTEHRSGLQAGNAGELDPRASAFTDAQELRQASYSYPGGTWIDASVIVSASGWPEPKYSLDARFNFDDEPQPWSEAEPQLTDELLTADLERFPRSAEATPGWIAARIGLPVGGPAGAPAPAAVPQEAAAAPAAPAEPPVLRTDVLTVRVDRDAVSVPSSPRHQRRQFELDRNVSLQDVLDYVGLPLMFTDGQGCWTVVAEGDGGTERIAAVVSQGTPEPRQQPPARIEWVTDASPADLLKDDGALYLTYRCTTGPADEVTAAAQRGQLWEPATSKGAVDNAVLRDAIGVFAASPGQEAFLNVLRQAMAGELLLDVTGSGPDAAAGKLAVTTVATPDGGTALVAFTRQEELGRFRANAGTPGENVQSLAQPAVGVLDFFLRDESYGTLYLDPAGPACALARRDVQLALASPHHDRLKNLLAEQPSQQQLFMALCGEGNQLLLAERTVNGRPQPVVVPGEGERPAPVLLAFTSAAEVAAYDSSLGLRPFDAGWILKFIVDQGMGGLRINPAGPSATMSGYQAWHILGNPAREQAPAPADELERVFGPDSEFAQIIADLGGSRPVRKDNRVEFSAVDMRFGVQRTDDGYELRSGERAVGYRFPPSAVFSNAEDAARQMLEDIREIERHIQSLKPPAQEPAAQPPAAQEPAAQPTAGSLPVPGEGATIGELVRSFVAGCESILGADTVRLNPPAAADALDAWAAELGDSFSRQLRELYETADGQAEWPSSFLFGEARFLPLAEVTGLNRVLERGFRLSRHGNVRDPLDPEEPALQPVQFDVQWIPFARTGGGDVLAVDTNPGPAGQYGQIVRAGGPAGSYPEVVASSLADLLRGNVTMLAEGEFLVTAAGSGDLESPEELDAPVIDDAGEPRFVIMVEDGADGTDFLPRR